ncbi:hypothetical protein ACH5RR_008417 [Cinchona calisaya]|uniref:RNase H type-1 domain-containing protein n=1 Tax=Cinchona calisaya TaxID=153742 RepID=A0ABD3AF60_9GENT
MNSLVQLEVTLVSNIFHVMFDGATNSHQSNFTIEVVIFNDRGSFVAGLLKKHLGLVDAEMAKAIAARDAALLARALFIPNFRLERNAQSLVRVIQDEDDEFSTLALVIFYVKAILADTNVASISWIRRQENRLAHEFAKFGKTCSQSESLWNSPLEFVNHLLLFPRIGK